MIGNTILKRKQGAIKGLKGEIRNC